MKKMKTFDDVKDLSIKMQAEMMVMNKLLVNLLMMFSHNVEIIRGLRASCMDEIKNLQFKEFETEEDKKRFLYYAEMSLDNFFSSMNSVDMHQGLQ